MRVIRRPLVQIVALAMVTCGARAAGAAAAAPLELGDPKALAPAPPSPYSLPWHLRPVLPVTALRSDTVLAFQDASRTVVSFASASVQAEPSVAFGVRYGWVHDAPDAGPSRSAFTNLAVSGMYAPRLSDAFRLAVTTGIVVPLAQGGGGAPDAAAQRAIASGGYARSGMDNTMFAPNDLSFFVSPALAYIQRGLTVQLEGTFFYLARVKGEASQVEAVKSNTTWGVHVGYFVLPQLSVAAEVRYQHHLAGPRAVDAAPERRDQATASIGVRGHVLVAGNWFRPGVAYGHPLDDPMAAAGYRIVQLDLPFVF